MKKTLLNSKKFCLCIDLDDTLYNEIDYVISGYDSFEKWYHFQYKKIIKYKLDKNEILKNLKNHVQLFIKKNQINEINSYKIIEFIRNHKPNILINNKNLKKLETLKLLFKNLVLTTNGRSITQNNKINCLGIKKYFKKIIISEEIGARKPQKMFYEILFKEFNNHNFIFIGDNFSIDLELPSIYGHKVILIQNKKNRLHELEKKTKNIEKINLIYNNFYNINIKDMLKLYS